MIDAGLLRALRLERTTRKIHERRLRDLMTAEEFSTFRRFAKAEAARDVELKYLADMTPEWPDEV